jgi:hypothetical protein
VDQDYEKPVIFAKDGSNIKVRVKRSDLANTCGSNTWMSTWTGDGAPAICNDDTHCIETNVAHTLSIINPDNINDDLDGHGYPQPVLSHYTGTLANAVTFTPASQPQFGPGTGYGPANSVGHATDANGQGSNIAIRPLSNATNGVTFHGSNLYRIKMVLSDDAKQWDSFSGPTYLDAGWGTKFTAWMPAHSVGTATPYIGIRDDANPDNPTRAGISLSVVSSFAQAPGHNSTCLQNGSGTGCPLSYFVPDYGGSADIEFLMVGPMQGPTVTATVGACSADPGGDCSKFTLAASVAAVSTDSQGRNIVKVHIVFTSTLPLYTGGVNYPVTVSLSGYGAVETRNVNLYR